MRGKVTAAVQRSARSNLPTEGGRERGARKGKTEKRKDDCGGSYCARSDPYLRGE